MANSPRLLLLSFVAIILVSSVAYAIVKHTRVIDVAYWSVAAAVDTRTI